MWTYWIRKEIARQFARSQKKRVKRFVDYGKVKALTVLVERENLDTVFPVLSNLLKEQFQVALVVLENGKSPNLDMSVYTGMEVLELTPENLKFGKHLPDKKSIKRFIGLNTGVLCDLSLTERLPFLYLMSISSAHMKIGLQKLTFNPYDFMIRSDKEITAQDLLEKILFYWRSIDIKDNNL